jgi:hypothetical protein
LNKVLAEDVQFAIKHKRLKDLKNIIQVSTFGWNKMAHNVFAASRSGDEPRPSLCKYKQKFNLKTFPMTNKSRTSPFLETAVVRWCLFQ